MPDPCAADLREPALLAALADLGLGRIDVLDEVVDGTPTHVSAASPWVYNGGTATFATGTHILRAVVTLTGGGTVTLTANFEAPSPIIVNPPPPTGGVVTDSAGTPLFLEYKGRKVADV